MRALIVIALLLMLVLTWGVGIAETRKGFGLASELTEAVPCGDHEMQEKLRMLMHEAADNALKQHFENTWLTWMRDDREQPRRAANGIRGGVNAYIRTRKALMNWKLMAC